MNGSSRSRYVSSDASIRFRTDNGFRESSGPRAESAQPVPSEFAFDDGSQSLTLGRGLCNLDHASPRLVECPCHRFDEQVLLALKMPVEASLFQAYLLHHRPDPARVTAALAKRASGHGKNLFVVLRFMFQRIPQDVRVRVYSNDCQGQN